MIDQTQLLPLSGDFGSKEVSLFPVVCGSWVANGSFSSFSDSLELSFVPLNVGISVCISLGLFMSILLGKFVMASRRCSYGSVILGCVGIVGRLEVSVVVQTCRSIVRVGAGL